MIGHLVTFVAAAVSQGAQPAFEKAACAREGLPATAECGVVRVPEDRSAAGGRSIALNLIVLRSPTPARLPPLFDIDGGPGLPGTKNAGFYAFNGVSKGRDVVLLDQRGTGRSNPLLCPELGATKATEPMLPRAAVERCRSALEKSADLRFYGTADAVQDLDSVRRALGYGRIDLFGLSYGTTVALAYMREYPENVRAAVLMGTAPPTAMPPRHHALAAQRAIDLIFDDCRAAESCNRRFPDVRMSLGRAIVHASAPNAPLAPELLMERVRMLSYTPATRAALPLAIERAATGDFSKLLGSRTETGASMVADGMFLAVTCGESFPLMDYAAAASAARTTPFGDYRLRRQSAACLGWPRVRLDPDHRDLPAASSASVLLISGDMDPVTPPEWADEVARSLKRARHVVVPAGGHIPDGLTDVETCLDPLMIAFLDHAEPERVDPSCVASMSAPSYLLE